MKLKNTLDLLVCEDCLAVTIMGDYTHFDYGYIEEEVEVRIDEVEKGIVAVMAFCHDADKIGHFSHSSDDGHKFTWSPCECCKSTLSGTKYPIQYVY
jgi:hypothetical protein